MKPAQTSLGLFTQTYFTVNGIASVWITPGVLQFAWMQKSVEYLFFFTILHYTVNLGLFKKYTGMFWDFYTFIDRTAGDEKGKGRREIDREREGGGPHAAEARVGRCQDSVFLYMGFYQMSYRAPQTWDIANHIEKK